MCAKQLDFIPFSPTKLAYLQHLAGRFMQLLNQLTDTPHLLPTPLGNGDNSQKCAMSLKFLLWQNEGREVRAENARTMPWNIEDVGGV